MNLTVKFNIVCEVDGMKESSMMREDYMCSFKIGELRTSFCTPFGKILGTQLKKILGNCRFIYVCTGVLKLFSK